MTLSLRRQSAAQKRANKTNLMLEQRRKDAISMLQQKKTMRTVRDITGLPLETICRLSKALKQAEKCKQDITELHNNDGPGRKNILTDYEEAHICERMKFVASRRFATDASTLKTIAAKIASDGRKGFKNGYPSDDWVRAFRSRHPEDVTFQRVEYKNVAKLIAEHPDHVATFVRALKECEKHNPGFLDDPEMIFNLDETEVGGQHGRLMKAFVGAENHCGGYNMSFTKPGKHLTACVIASDAGAVLPPFLIFEGRKNMDRWYDPLPEEIYKDSGGVPHWLSQHNWYPDHSAEYGTASGSMTMDTIGLVMSHISLHAPKKPEPGRKLLLLLDGHKSRNGVKWLEKALLFNIEVVQSPANRTQFLQPCDNEINRTFQRAVRSTHDHLNSIAHLNFAETGNRIKLAIAGCRSLTPSIVQKAFVNTGLWPIDFRFHTWATEKHTGKRCDVVARNQRLERRRTGDHIRNFNDIMKSKNNSVDIWRSVSSYVQRESKRTLDIIEECTPTKTKTVKFLVEERSGFDVSKAAPGAYLTHKGVLELRRSNAAKKEQERTAKATEKATRAQRKLQAEEAQKQKRIELQREREAKKELKKSITKPARRNTKPKKTKSVVNVSVAVEKEHFVCGSTDDVIAASAANRSVQTFQSQMNNEHKKLELKEMCYNSENDGEKDVAQILLKMHNIEPELNDTQSIVFDLSVGDQAVLDEPHFVPFALVSKEDDVHN